jgi:hypothetical protein
MYRNRFLTLYFTNIKKFNITIIRTYNTILAGARLYILPLWVHSLQFYMKKFASISSIFFSLVFFEL